MVDVSPANARRPMPNTKIAALKAREAKPNAFILDVTVSLRVMMFRSQNKYNERGALHHRWSNTAKTQLCPADLCLAGRKSFPTIILVGQKIARESPSHEPRERCFLLSSMVAGGFQSYHMDVIHWRAQYALERRRQSLPSTSLH